MTPEQSAVLGLKSYLTGELATVPVRIGFPYEPLTAEEVSILLLGDPEELQVDPQVVKVEAGSVSTSRLYTWRMRVAVFQAQLDAWALSEPARDELVQKCRTALNRGEGYTLNAAHVPAGVTPIYWGNPVRDGILLALDPAKGWSGFAAWSFSGPNRIQDGDEAQQKQYRALWRGELGVDVLVKAESAAIASIILKNRLGEGALGTGPLEITTVQAEP